MRNVNVHLWLMTGQWAEVISRRCEGGRRVSATLLPPGVGLIPKWAGANLLGTADRHPYSRAVGGSAAEPTAVKFQRTTTLGRPWLAGRMTRAGTACCTYRYCAGRVSRWQSRKYRSYLRPNGRHELGLLVPGPTKLWHRIGAEIA